MDPIETDLDVVVDNQNFVLNDTVDGLPMCAILRWSMLRSSDRQSRIRIGTGSARDDGDARIIAGDLRVELLADDLYDRMTRGVEVILHEYQVFDGPRERSRGRVARGLAAEVIGQAMTWPQDWWVE